MKLPTQPLQRQNKVPPGLTQTFTPSIDLCSVNIRGMSDITAIIDCHTQRYGLPPTQGTWELSRPWSQGGLRSGRNKKILRKKVA